MGNNMLLDCENGSQKAGSNILLWACHGADNQRIRVIKLADGNYELQLLYSCQVLDIADTSKKSGANVLQWNRNGSYNQR